MSATATAPASAAQAIPMTDEQKFFFDLKGWLLVPGVLPAGQIEELKRFVEQLKKDPQSLPPEQRSAVGGPVGELLDHPAIVGILREILAAPDPSPDCYGFRCDGSYHQFRPFGDPGIEPHGGGPNVSPMFSYQCKNQQIYSGLTRVVWELTEVEQGKGGTLLMSGSHKANFSVPAEHLKRDSALFETYGCPAGSVLFFSENLCHSASTWNNPKHPRIAVFNAYAAACTQYHKMRWSAPVIEAMPPKRRTLFRGVWGADFHKNPPIINDWYGEDNRAY